MADQIRSSAKGAAANALVTYDAGSAPGIGFAAITPSDSQVYNPTPRALYVGTTGDIAIKGSGDTSPTVFKAVPAGTILPCQPAYVMGTNTTASNIVAIY